ncbi:MAG: DNA repair protein RadC [Pseudomonadota bacterium]|nr:DNA repair protein RadC [Pseudomonadota bacterium]
MTIRDWDAAERPREKLASRGADALSDAELLAILLRTGRRGKTAVDLARELLQTAGGLRQLFSREDTDLCQVNGLGPAKIAQLRAAATLTARVLAQTIERGAPIDSPTATARFLKARMRDYRQEVFACLLLDNRHRVLAFEELFRGTINGASIHPREVVRSALRHNAAAVIFAHNHPSGVAEPSVADREITRRLADALGLVDVRVLDHLVIGDEQTTSFAEQGLL